MEYLKPDQDKELRQALLPEQDKMKMHSPVHLLHKTQCCFVLFLA